MNNKTKFLARAGVIGALYCVITLVAYPLSFGPIQLRFSESMCILPLFFPESVVGLTIGCLIANIFSAVNPLLDVPLGTIATLLASICTYLVGKHFSLDLIRIPLGIIPPVLFNAVIVPFSILAVSELGVLYAITALQIGISQTIVLCAVGIPLYYAIKRIKPKIIQSK